MERSSAIRKVVVGESILVAFVSQNFNHFSHISVMLLIARYDIKWCEVDKIHFIRIPHTTLYTAIDVIDYKLLNHGSLLYLFCSQALSLSTSK